MRDIVNYQKEYQKSNFETNYQVYYRRKKVLEQIEKYEHQVVLEVGCGLEPLCKYVPNYTKWIIVEPGEKFASKASENFENDDKIKILNCYFEDSLDKIEHYKYDMIIISGLLHEVDNPESIIRTLSSICNDYTVVHINVPNANSIHRLWAYESGLIKDVKDKSRRNVDLMQNKVFDMEYLVKCLEDNLHDLGYKLNILDSGGYFIKPFDHEKMEECLKYGILNADLIDGLYKLSKYMPNYGSEIYVDFGIKKEGE